MRARATSRKNHLESIGPGVGAAIAQLLRDSLIYMNSLHRCGSSQGWLPMCVFRDASIQPKVSLAGTVATIVVACASSGATLVR